ncbi:hypothetical protein HGP14_09545 [Rhizobium sp. P32RR-XVIII]|uniref:hypothetical protein n=1 Tax=Rhizobium sp. P32RR-XVIII TaxID=2726738 RepID=UPI0014568F38|nr:hypothetical protein [Rhizobium sp. P32RR-XVIII]NLS03601.1 hypothetical protein [Rhizobium sp. P32RR-XVIII]
MNEFAGYTRPVPGGHWGMLRFARDGHPKPIMGEGDRPIVFATELEALRAVNRHLLAYFNGDYRRDGAKLEASSAGDALFNLKPFVKQRGKERRTIVERIGA